MIYETKYETKNGRTTVARQENKPKTAKTGASAGASSAETTSTEEKK